MVQEFLTDTDENVVIKILSGLTIKKDIVPADKTNLKKNGNITADKITFLSAKLSDYFKKKINKLCRERENNNIEGNN